MHSLMNIRRMHGEKMYETRTDDITTDTLEPASSGQVQKNRCDDARSHIRCIKGILEIS